MAEPENLTLRVLREFREEARHFQSRTEQDFAEIKRGVADVKGDVTDVRGDLSEVRVNVAEMNQHVDKLTQAVAGEIVKSRYETAGVNDRLNELERRLAALEQSR
jgi:hypothetical protein